MGLVIENSDRLCVAEIEAASNDLKTYQSRDLSYLFICLFVYLFIYFPTGVFSTTDS